MIKKILIAGIFIGGCWASAEGQLVECTFKDPVNSQVLETVSKVIDSEVAHLIHDIVNEDPSSTDLEDTGHCNWISGKYGKFSWARKNCP